MCSICDREDAKIKEVNELINSITDDCIQTERIIEFLKEYIQLIEQVQNDRIESSFE